MQTPSFGLFLNMGANLGPTPESIFQLTLKQAQFAETLGYSDLWVTEHHFIPFGLSPSALTTSAFLLGRTKRLRVGTAVTLCPLYHPVELAERAALLDQFSEGRFDLGIGRGGYLRDYQVLNLDTARWDDEPEASGEVILNAWRGNNLAPLTGQETTEHIPLQPPPRTQPNPPLFVATSSKAGIAFAARHGLGLQHYFATPVEARVKLEDKYREASLFDEQPAHVHTLIVVVTENETRARAQLQCALTQSFKDGEWPHVPQAGNRHTDKDGKPLDRGDMAKNVAQSALVGPPEKIREQLSAFVETTQAKRLVLYMEAVADELTTLRSIELFAEQVMAKW
ncbi:MAG: LLM class flavin-dependent oxidoreductase [Pseudomonadota bacterium]